MAVYPKKILSFCSGIGGIDLGLKLALRNARTVCYVEREAYPCAILVKRMQAGLLDEAPIWTNLETFAGRPWRGKVDIIAGGFPCQPFSVAGKREGIKDRRWIWNEIERIIREVEPKTVFLENVPGLCKEGLPHVIGSLATLGYNAEWGVFSAEQIGAPHKRERLFILGELVDTHSVRRGTSVSPQNGKYSLTSGLSLDFNKREVLFPPRPRDKKTWGKIFKNTQNQFKPALFELDDGITGSMGEYQRNDLKNKIRAVGNGVVPLTVAFAFRVLQERLNGF